MHRKDELHDYQQRAIDFLFEHDSALALLPVGAGKSVIGWTVAQELMDAGHVKRPLVFAPMRVAQLVWPAERFEWEHLKDEPIVAWGGEPSSWEPSPWQQSRILWGQREARENRLKKVASIVQAKLLRELRKTRPTAEPGDINPNQLKDAIAAEEGRLKDALAEIVSEQRHVNKQVRRLEPPEMLHVTSFENLMWLCDLYAPGESPFDMWIFDEIGKLKNPKSPRYKEVRKHTKAVLAEGGMVYGLNATPAPEGFEDLFTQVQIVVGDKLWGKSFYDWRKRYFVPADYHGYSWRLQLGAKDILMRDLNKIAFKVDESELSYQRSMQHSQIPVELPPAARAAYTQMERLMMLDMEKRGVEDIVAFSAATASMKLRQITQGFVYDDEGRAHVLHEEKAHALADLIDELGKEPLLVAYEFAEDLAAIRRVWKNVPYLGQGISAAQAKETVERWNRRELPVLALHPFSAGHGLNLQKGGSHIAWYALPWPLESFQQTNGRIDRQGQTRACFGHHIVALNSIDERVSDVLVEKDIEQADIIRAIRSV